MTQNYILIEHERGEAGGVKKEFLKSDIHIKKTKTKTDGEKNDESWNAGTESLGPEETARRGEDQEFRRPTTSAPRRRHDHPVNQGRSLQFNRWPFTGVVVGWCGVTSERP